MSERLTVKQMALLAGLTLFLVWSYLPTLAYLSQKWLSDPQYSHGLLVPIFSVALLWLRPRTWGSAAPLLGFSLLVVAMGCRLGGALIYHRWLDAFSLLPCLGGLLALGGGWMALRWTLPSVLFLIFMIPMPYIVEWYLGSQLLRVATLGSTFLLQVLGLPAVAEGNTILINSFQLGIVDACSGLRMLMTFTAFSVATVLVIRRGWIENGIIIAAAVPIALLSNIIRIVMTGVLCVSFDSHTAHAFFHDLAGWFMMPVGLTLLLSLLWWLRTAISYEMTQPEVVRL